MPAVTAIARLAARASERVERPAPGRFATALWGGSLLRYPRQSNYHDHPSLRSILTADFALQAPHDNLASSQFQAVRSCTANRHGLEELNQQLRWNGRGVFHAEEHVLIQTLRPNRNRPGDLSYAGGSVHQQELT